MQDESVMATFFSPFRKYWFQEMKTNLHMQKDHLSLDTLFIWFDYWIFTLHFEQIIFSDADLLTPYATEMSRTQGIELRRS